MKTWKIWLNTKEGTETFIISAMYLDDAIADAKSQLPSGTRVNWSGGQVV